MVIVGIDEVGRGCWAGPLVAGAVILGTPVVGLKDSKQLSSRQRETLAPQIEAAAVAVGLGWVSPRYIDTYGISWSVKTAMERALHQIAVEYDEIIIDGNINYFPTSTKARAVIKADGSVAAVSAASILAKVARDRYMSGQDALYGAYGFAAHVGYGTRQHRAALELLGVSPIHRRSYKPIHALLAHG